MASLTVLAYCLLNSCRTDTAEKVMAVDGSTKMEGVYICTGPMARVYHSDMDCPGLQRCSAEIIEVSVEEAREEDRRPCRICY